MRPFIEIDNEIFQVVCWEPDMPDRERYKIRRLDPRDARRYRENREAMDIELHENFKTGTRPAKP